MCEQCFVQAENYSNSVETTKQNKGKDISEKILNDIVNYNLLCWVSFL